MSEVKIQIEPITATSGGRARRKLLLRGKMRDRVKRLRTQIVNMMAADSREARRAEAKGYAPLLFREAANSGYARAMSTIFNRATALLNARA